MTNAARQAQIYAALGWNVPNLRIYRSFTGGRPNRQCHGALGVEAYRDMGYLPEAMRIIWHARLEPRR